MELSSCYNAALQRESVSLPQGFASAGRRMGLIFRLILIVEISLRKPFSDFIFMPD